MERYFLDKNTSIIYYTSNVFAVIFTITFLYITWKYRHHFPLKEYDTPLMYLIVLTFMMLLMAYLALNNIQDYVTKKTYGNSDKELYGICMLQIVFLYICSLLWLMIVLYYFMYKEKPVLLLWSFISCTIFTIVPYFDFYYLLNKEIVNP